MTPFTYIVRMAITPLMALLAFAMTALPCVAVHVRGHYRKDGTYVAPHYRRSPSSSRSTTSYGTAVPYGNLILRSPQNAAQEPCAWIDEKGDACGRNANPGYKYCYRHVGLAPPPTQINHDAGITVAGQTSVAKQQQDERAADALPDDMLTDGKAAQEPGNAATANLSLGEISVEQGLPPLRRRSESRCTVKKTWRASWSVGVFLALLCVSAGGFWLFSHCSTAHKIVRISLTIPCLLGASLLAYWYIPVRQSWVAGNASSEEGVKTGNTWQWSSKPESRLLFVVSREKIKGDNIQLVLNGKGKPYVGIAFPDWLNVQKKETIPVAAKFDANDTLQDPWIRAKDGSGIYAPWSMKDFIEAAEVSQKFGVTFEGKNKMTYTFTFDIQKLQITLGPDRKHFIGGE